MGLAVLTLACGPGREIGGGGPALEPSALNSPPREVPVDVREVRVVVENGRFDKNFYTALGGEVRLIVRTVGGPYTLTIDELVLVPQKLPANSETTVGFTVIKEGPYIMRIRETGEGATLSIRGPSG